MTVYAGSGDARLAYNQRHEELLFRDSERFPTRTVGLELDRRYGALAATLGVSWLREERSLLGARFHPAIGQGGADTGFLDLAARWQPGGGWSAGGEWRLGLTRPDRGSVITIGSQLLSQAWAFDLTRASAFVRSDSLGLRLSQPLRVEYGGISLNLPASYDYASETAGFAIQRLSLAPQGREVVGELAWQGSLPWGRAGASLFYRHEPGHYARAPADAGAMVSFNAGF